MKSRGLRQVLCFVRTKHGASRLARQLEKDGLETSAIHGDKTQGARIEALDAFKEGKLEVLVATDVAARGLDVDDLPLVVNYELPHVPEDYIHRIGRTGRAGATGEAISFVAPDEEKYLADIERLLKKKIAPSDARRIRSDRPRADPFSRAPRIARARRTRASRARCRAERAPRATGAGARHRRARRQRRRAAPASRSARKRTRAIPTSRCPHATAAMDIQATSALVHGHAAHGHRARQVAPRPRAADEAQGAGNRRAPEPAGPGRWRRDDAACASSRIAAPVSRTRPPPTCGASPRTPASRSTSRAVPAPPT